MTASHAHRADQPQGGAGIPAGPEGSHAPCWACGLALLVLAGLGAGLTGCGSPQRPSPVPEAQDYLREGRLAFQRGNTREALDRFSQALALGETEDNLFTRVVAQLNLAVTYQRRGALADAEAAFAQAQAAIPLLLKEQPNVAKIDLDMLLGEYHETRAQIHRQRGEWEAMADELDAAEAAYRSALDG